ncbi:MAG TPA: hypothetical protein VHN14_36800 [Kofleriaceae bacterium]|jgi:CRISPR/Cas system-associated exonuclease Cas4 (RecB family)|nr:hypothetical protein [Kofleriaceae bacterium]
MKQAFIVNLGCHVQISAHALVYGRMFSPDVVIEVVTLLKWRHSRIAAQQAWLIQLMVEIAGAITAVAFPPNPSRACTGCEFAEPCFATGGPL